MEARQAAALPARLLQATPRLVVLLLLAGGRLSSLQVALPQPMGCLARRVLRQQATRQQALVLGLLRVGRVADAQQRPCQRP